MTVVLTCVKDTLDLGRRQTLTLEIKSDAERSVTVVIPLGSGGAALMTKEEFDSTRIDCDPDILRPPTVQDGAARLRLVGDGTVAAELSLVDFLVGTAGTVVIRAVDHDDKTLETLEVRKTTTPRIERFEAKPYNLPEGGIAELRWEIRPDPGDDLQLFIDNDKIDDPRLGKLRRQVAAKADITLSLRSRTGQEVAKRQLRIHAIDHTGFYGYQLTIPSGSPRGIMGIHAGDGSLCVLIREDDTVASLWKTANGFDHTAAAWREECWQSRNPAPTPLRIPLAAARRPGVIFQNKLWLLGGDCCHPDYPLGRIGSYNFQAVGGFRDDAAPWPARMGHAVFADDRHIWVAGGWRQGGGALNDIWQFDGKTWLKLPDPPWQPRCLFGAAATLTDVWIAGGFDAPGGKTYDDIWRYSKSSSKWEKIEPKLCEKDEHQYVAGSMFVLGDQPRALTVYYDPKTTNYLVVLHTMYKSMDKWGKVAEPKEGLTDALPRYDYFSLNTTVFSRAAFLWRLKPNIHEKHLDSMVRYYMILEAPS